MYRPFTSLMLRTLLGPLVAGLQLFALYVFLHGHYSPGGGFQAGVLLACSLILPILIHGHRRWRRAPLPAAGGAAAVSAAGVLIFAGIGIAAMLRGGSMLDYAALPMPGLPAAQRRSLGILGIELGVTLAVAGAAVSIFLALYADEEEG